MKIRLELPDVLELECFQGRCSFIDIVEYDDHELSKQKSFVRWCAFCGSIIVDSESNTRTRQGVFVPVQFPEITEKLFQIAKNKIEKEKKKNKKAKQAAK